MSLRGRVALIYLAVSAALTGCAALLAFNSVQRGLEHNLNGLLRARTRVIAADLDAEPGAQRFRARADVPAGVDPRRIIQMVDDKDKLLLSSSLAPPTALVSLSDIRRATADVTFVDVRASVPRDPGRATVDTPLRVAVLRIGPDQVLLVGTRTALQREAEARIALILTALGAGLTLAGTILAYILVSVPLRAVERLRQDAAVALARGVPVLRTPHRDTREIARLRATLSQLIDEQLRAVQSERAFVADASHGLRNPLAVLVGEIAFAQRTDASAADRDEALRAVDREARRLVRLTNLLLGLAQETAGGPLPMTRVDLVVVCQKVLALRQRDAAARRVRLTLEALGPAHVAGDEGRLYELVDNLVDNATRFAPTGSSILVKVRSDTEHVRLSIRDGGPGFSPDFLPRAFDRFQRDERSGAAQGSGLGLALVKSIASMHGGTVIAKNVDPGAEVTVCLPAENRTQAADPVLPDRRR